MGFGKNRASKNITIAENGLFNILEKKNRLHKGRYRAVENEQFLHKRFIYQLSRLMN